MRQRRLKDLDERMDNLKDWFFEDPEALKGHWNEYFVSKGREDGSKIFLEIGCGKGKFITGHAVACPENNYIALEGQESVIVRAMARAEELELENLAFLSVYMDDIRDYFENDEIDGIYLNFSDPWPKARHAKRRLTFRKFLERYRDIIKPGGFIEVKTDNDGLYDFSLEEAEALGYDITEKTRDLHNSEYSKENIMTEYEEKFSQRGKNINYLRIEFSDS